MDAAPPGMSPRQDQDSRSRTWVNTGERPECKRTSIFRFRRSERASTVAVSFGMYVRTRTAVLCSVVYRAILKARPQGPRTNCMSGMSRRDRQRPPHMYTSPHLPRRRRPSCTPLHKSCPVHSVFCITGGVRGPPFAALQGARVPRPAGGVHAAREQVPMCAV
ncbi:hypothetical protein PYCCODRAFT_747888 [Trametes coccinea BRFM310]|uniref:Uncharacterized protein n=1 Tax=Trametes coccinea (strain BRFM310) TaxID=1353009 RepID=A0A1Y2IEZ0_TRAC3|nr:hypothetical protein PYCCODRAFT_747888 [Trametes coccinea BRFM310]